VTLFGAPPPEGGIRTNGEDKPTWAVKPLAYYLYAFAYTIGFVAVAYLQATVDPRAQRDTWLYSVPCLRCGVGCNAQ